MAGGELLHDRGAGFWVEEEEAVGVVVVVGEDPGWTGGRLRAERDGCGLGVEFGAEGLGGPVGVAEGDFCGDGPEIVATEEGLLSQAKFFESRALAGPGTSTRGMPRWRIHISAHVVRLRPDADSKAWIRSVQVALPYLCWAR